MLNYVVIFYIVNFGLASVSGGAIYSLDDIIMQISESKKILHSYIASYEINEKREATGSQPKMNNHITGTITIDRKKHFYKCIEEGGYSYEASSGEWIFGKSTNGSFSDARKGLFESYDGKTIVGTIREFNANKSGSSGIERYFSGLWGSPLEEFLDKYREDVGEIKKIDDYKYKITLYPQMEDTIGAREEFIIDAKYGWNLVSAKGYRKTGEMRYDYQMDYVNINNIPFLQKVDAKEYMDITNTKLVTKSVILTTDMSSIVINPEIKEEIFHIDFPKGCMIADAILNLHYKIPDKLDGVYDIYMDPTINILMPDESKPESVTETAEVPQEPNVSEITIENNSNLSNTNNQTGKEAMTDVTAKSNNWKVIIGIVFVLALFVIFYKFYILRRS